MTRGSDAPVGAVVRSSDAQGSALLVLHAGLSQRGCVHPAPLPVRRATASTHPSGGELERPINLAERVDRVPLS